MRRRDPDAKLKTILLDASLFFDTIPPKLGNHISEKTFQQIKKTSQQLLEKLFNIGYYNSKMIVMNEEQCLQFNLKNGVEKCTNNPWEQINTENAIRLKNNLLQSYDPNGNLFLYKTYLEAKQRFAAGIILRI